MRKEAPEKKLQVMTTNRPRKPRDKPEIVQ
jgi:hypothetical protein